MRTGVGADSPRSNHPSLTIRSNATGDPPIELIYTRVYTNNMEELKAKIFRNGGSQAVRLPKECRFPEGQKEVLVRKEGSRIVLEPSDDWSEEFKKCLGSLKEEIPRIKQDPITDLKNVFD